MFENTERRYINTRVIAITNSISGLHDIEPMYFTKKDLTTFSEAEINSVYEAAGEWVEEYEKKSRDVLYHWNMAQFILAKCAWLRIDRFSSLYDRGSQVVESIYCDISSKVNKEKTE